MPDFGDYRYGTTPSVLKSAHHPEQRCSGLALAGGLASAYSYGQQAPRLLGAWQPPHRDQRLSIAILSSSSDQLVMASMRVWLPDATTHVRATMAFGVPPDQTYEVDRYIRIDSGTPASISEELVGTDADYAQSLFRLPFGAVFVRSVEIDYKPSGPEFVQVTAWLQRGNVDSTAYIAHSCVLTAEVRDG